MDNQLRAQIELLIGEAQVNLADYADGRHHLEQGLSLLGQPVPAGSVLQFFGVIEQILIQVAHRIWPERFISRKAADRDNLLASSRASERLVEVYFTTNEVLLSLFTAFRSLNLAEDAGVSPELARGYATVGALVGFIPLHGTATSYLERALETIETLDDINAQIWIHIVAGFYYIGAGHWSEASRLLDEALMRAERLGDHRRREDILGNIAALNFLQGRFAVAAELAEQLIEFAYRRSADYSLGIGLDIKANTSLHMGNFDRALESLRQLESLFLDEAKVTDEALRLDMHGLFALTHLRRAEITESLEAAGQAMELSAKSTPSNYSSFTGYAAPACVYLQLWEDGHQLEDLDRLSWKACKSFRKYARVFPIGQPRALLLVGRHYWLSGRRARAHQTWQESLELSREMTMQYDEGLALYQIGRHLEGNDPLRKETLIKAAEIFQRTGAIFDLERTEAALKHR